MKIYFCPNLRIQIMALVVSENIVQKYCTGRNVLLLLLLFTNASCWRFSPPLKSS